MRPLGVAIDDKIVRNNARRVEEKYQLLVKGRDRHNGFDISEQRRQLCQGLRRDGLNAENRFSRKRDRPVAGSHGDEAFAPTDWLSKSKAASTTGTGAPLMMHKPRTTGGAPATDSIGSIRMFSMT